MPANAEADPRATLSAAAALTRRVLMRERFDAPLRSPAVPGSGLESRERGLHLPVDGVDGLQRPDHDPELHDPVLVVAAEDVDAVDVLAVDRRLELQHRKIAIEHLLGVTERARAV